MADSGASIARGAVQIRLQMNYDGAQALLAALERRNITDGEIDRLLAIRGVAAMVDNTTKYLPGDTRQVFRQALKQYVATRRVTVGHFGLKSADDHTADARKAVTALKSDANLTVEVTAPVTHYPPASGPLTVVAYCVAGGASDGFVVDGDPSPSFYMAIDRSQGDADGIKLNMAHEIYHVAQRAARSRVHGLNARIFNEKTASPAARLLTTVLDEGTATYVARTMLGRGTGPYISMWRGAYAKNEPRKQIAANFALFDRLLAALHDGSMTWNATYEAGFANIGPPLYFVGYEMAKAIERAYGPGRIGPYFQRGSTEYFKDYIALYRTRAMIALERFSPATESLIASLGG